MVPDAADRPDVLPSERLLANGMAIPELRPALRHIDNARNALTVVSVWFWVVLIIGGAVWLDAVVELPDRLRPHGADVRPLRHPHARGGAQAPLHQQAVERLDRHLGHRLPGLHPGAALPPGPLRPPQGRVRARRARPRLLPALPAAPGRALRRRLFRDAVGISGWKNFVPLVKNTRTKPFRRIGLSIFGVQAAARGPSCGLATGRWWIYPLLWWLPWMTQWRVINRLRSIAEHGGMERSKDRRATTHNVRQSLPGPLLVRALQHGLAPGPPCRHGRALAQPAGLPRRAGAAPATSPTPSPTPVTGPSGRRSRAPRRRRGQGRRDLSPPPGGPQGGLGRPQTPMTMWSVRTVTRMRTSSSVRMG